MKSKAKELWVVTEGNHYDVELFMSKPTRSEDTGYGNPGWRVDGNDSLFQFCSTDFRRATGISLRKRTPTRISVRVVGGGKK